MLWLLRHLVAIAALPFVVTVIVPLWIARRYDVALRPGSQPGALVLQLAGGTLLVVGVLLFGATLRRFAGEGRGTLAPWDPPRRLVVRGAYRFVRNPMISGVACIVLGEALVLRSVPHASWAAVFVAINAVYIPLVEEPQLARRFGEAYRDYCRHVPRLVPRLTPWEQGGP